MAEVETNNTGATDDQINGGEEKKPTVNELLVKIAQMEKAQEEQKKTLDKTLREKGEIQKQLRNKLTAEEQAAEEKAQEEAKQAEYVKGLERQIKLAEAKNRYLGLGMNDDVALETAKYELDNDMDGVSHNIAKLQAAQKKSWEAEFLKNRPEINTSEGECPVTKEQMEHMGYTARVEFATKYPDKYKEYTGRR